MQAGIWLYAGCYLLKMLAVIWLYAGCILFLRYEGCIFTRSIIITVQKILPFYLVSESGGNWFFYIKSHAALKITYYVKFVKCLFHTLSCVSAHLARNIVEVCDSSKSCCHVQEDTADMTQ